MGSKIAARYKASIGEVNEEAMMEEACGSRDLRCLANELRLPH